MRGFKDKNDIGGSLKRYLAASIAALFLSALATPVSVGAATWDGGRISGEKILSPSEGVYEISETIEIPDGSQLTVKPGTKIVNTGADPLFHVHGTLAIEGSSSKPVNLESSKDILYSDNAPRTARIIIKHAYVDGKDSASLVPPSGSERINYEFLDSDFINLGTYSYIWYPRSFRAERNTFKNSAGFSIGFRLDYPEDNTQPVFRNNLFDGAPKESYGDEYWIQLWAAYDGELLVEKNTFAGGPYTAIRNQYGDDKSVRAERNYWETVDESTIQDMVYDSADSLSIGGVISTGSPLSSPDPLTPSAVGDRTGGTDSTSDQTPPNQQDSVTNSLSAGGTSLSWDADSFYEPSGCTQYSFEYSQTDVLFATMQIRNSFNDTIAIGAPSGSSGTESLQVCDFQYDASDAPFKLVLSSTADFSAGGETTESEASISFRSRSESGDSDSGSVNVDHLAGQGPDDGAFKAWTKMMSNEREIKFYAKYLQPGQKVQFMVQNSSGNYVQYAWKRVESDDLNSDRSYVDMQNHIYFIRTLELEPGKNRVRVLVDGEIVWGTKTYVR